ncbi:hypothetical protein B0T20DRAFT_405364 [Sordaria brevicollis]|uniref:Uncharacterized protein n=1 Tax=Sordaria brevicollis TaxID=83679 RepID=A0AAE0UE39_SORBR|nr:hypothetical protein B0T20DRAFT_405364 [Sordaria brevicollis]
MRTTKRKMKRRNVIRLFTNTAIGTKRTRRIPRISKCHWSKVFTKSFSNFSRVIVTGLGRPTGNSAPARPKCSYCRRRPTPRTGKRTTSTQLRPSKRTTSTQLSPSKRTTSIQLSPSTRTTSTQMSSSKRTTSTQLSPSKRTTSTQLSPSTRTTSTQMSPSERTLRYP